MKELPVHGGGDFRWRALCCCCPNNKTRLSHYTTRPSSSRRQFHELETLYKLQIYNKISPRLELMSESFFWGVFLLMGMLSHSPKTAHWGTAGFRVRVRHSEPRFSPNGKLIPQCAYSHRYKWTSLFWIELIWLTLLPLKTSPNYTESCLKSWHLTRFISHKWSNLIPTIQTWYSITSDEDRTLPSKHASNKLQRWITPLRHIIGLTSWTWGRCRTETHLKRSASICLELTMSPKAVVASWHSSFLDFPGI